MNGGERESGSEQESIEGEGVRSDELVVDSSLPQSREWDRDNE